MVETLLPLALVAPLIAALITPWIPEGRGRSILTIALPLVSFLSLTALYQELTVKGSLYLFVPDFGSIQGFSLGLDRIGFLLALVAALIWTLVTLFAQEYMAPEKEKTRFYAFLSLANLGTLGVFLAGDLLTLLLFFELMTLTSYVLVVHNQDRPALEAGRLYLFLGVLSGLLILLGIAILAAAGENLSFFSSREILSTPGLRLLAAGSLILGFGIKAGMVPVHIWLPEAHPVAPTPASALLSGIMIKSGAYGIFRTLTLFFPNNPLENWLGASQLGLAVLWLGIITMFTGVVMALLQENMKRMLACHSISQMGYILVGLGGAAYLGQEGALGMAGGIYHIVNHALFKSTLFLTAGMIYLKTKELNMYNLGGLGRRLPFTALAATVAALGISGFPGLNGYASKTLLHHSLALAAAHGHPSLHLAEKIFVLTGAGTTASMLKLIYYTYIRKPRQAPKIHGKEGWPAKIAMGALAAAIILIGIRPELLVQQIFVPAAAQFPYAPEGIAHHLAQAHFWTIANLKEIGISFLLGVFIFVGGSRTGLFHWHPPCWCSIHYLGRAVLNGLLSGGTTLWSWAAQQQQNLKHMESLLMKEVRITLNRLDVRPGESQFYRAICVANLNFDVVLIFVILALILFLYTPSIIFAGGL